MNLLSEQFNSSLINTVNVSTYWHNDIILRKSHWKLSITVQSAKTAKSDSLLTNTDKLWKDFWTVYQHCSANQIREPELLYYIGWLTGHVKHIVFRRNKEELQGCLMSVNGSTWTLQLLKPQMSYSGLCHWNFYDLSCVFVIFHVRYSNKKKLTNKSLLYNKSYPSNVFI